jgi:hypothetical protein
MKTNSTHTLAIVYASVCSPGAFVKRKIPQRLEHGENNMLVTPIV